MNKRKKDNLKTLLRYFPEKLRTALDFADNERLPELCEIRIRVSMPVVLVFNDGKYFLTGTGRLTPFYSNSLMIMTENEVKTVFEKMCNYSVYSLTNNIRNGFITVENGCRVGVYGVAVNEGDGISSVRNIRGLNIRLAGDYNCASSDVKNLFMPYKQNVLICGPPSSGKTTLLKDLCRSLSDEMGYKVAVIDERFEFENYYLGYNTDVLSGYSKCEGTMISLRTLSPEIIVFDEIGTVDEVRAVAQGVNSGVTFVMSIHCRTKEDLLNKEQVRLLMEYNVADCFVFLSSKAKVNGIVYSKEIKNAYGSTYNNSDCLCNDRELRCTQL